MKTTNQIQIEGTAPTSSSTTSSYTYPCPYLKPKAEQGWECPRCGRINAPWVRQCDCQGNYWYTTWTSDKTTTGNEPEQWTKITCDADTFKVHPDSTIYQVGGSDYKEGNTYVNVPGTQSNKIQPDITTYKTDVPTTLTNNIDNLQKQLDSTTLCNDVFTQIKGLEERVNEVAKAAAYNNFKPSYKTNK